jgi:hypothetical protein
MTSRRSTQKCDKRGSRLSSLHRRSIGAHSGLLRACGLCPVRGDREVDEKRQSPLRRVRVPPRNLDPIPGNSSWFVAMTRECRQLETNAPATVRLVQFLLFSKREIEDPQKKFRDRTPNPMIHTHVLRLAPTPAETTNRCRTEARSEPMAHESMDVSLNAHRLGGFASRLRFSSYPSSRAQPCDSSAVWRE